MYHSTTDARNGLLAMSLCCFMTGIALVVSIATAQVPAFDGDEGYRLERRREAMKMAMELMRDAEGGAPAALAYEAR